MLRAKQPLLLCTYIDLCLIYITYICPATYGTSTVQGLYHIFSAMGGPEGVGPHYYYYYYSLRQLFPGGGKRGGGVEWSGVVLEGLYRYKENITRGKE